MFGLKSASKLELSFSSMQLFVSSSYVACVLLEIGRDKLGHVDCDRNLTLRNIQLAAHTLSICHLTVYVQLPVGAMNTVNSVHVDRP